VPHARSGEEVGCEMSEDACTVHTGDVVMFAPVGRVRGRIEETAVVAGMSFEGEVLFLEGEDGLFGDSCPVGDVMIHEGGVIDEDLESGYACFLSHGSELDVIIGIAAVTPDDGVEYHSAVTHIDAACTSMPPAVVGDVRAGAAVGRNGTMVDGTTFGEVYTSSFGIGGVVINDAGGSIG